MTLAILAALVPLIGAVFIAVSIWKRTVLPAAVLYIVLGLPIRWHLENLIPYLDDGEALAGYIAVFILLFLLPGVGIILRVALGWWVALITTGILGFIAPGSVIVAAAADRSGDAILVQLVIVHVVLYLPCFVALAVNHPRTWRRQVLTTASD